MVIAHHRRTDILYPFVYHCPATHRSEVPSQRARTLLIVLLGGGATCARTGLGSITNRAAVEAASSAANEIQEQNRVPFMSKPPPVHLAA